MRSEDAKSVYVISVAAELSGMHPQTLRVYERKGLVAPGRTAGNTRRYSEEDIARLRRIQELTHEQGVNLAGVKMVIRLEERIRDLERRVEEAEHRLQEARREATDAVERVHRSYRRDLVPMPRSLLPATRRGSR